MARKRPEHTKTTRSKSVGNVDVTAKRSKRRLAALGHLKRALGADVVRNLGASDGKGLEVVRRKVEAGVPVEAVAELQKQLGKLHVPRPSQYVELVASRATRSRRRTLTQDEGERLVRVAGVVARSLDVWEDPDDASDFLITSHPMLDGDAPIDRARSELGARQVEDLLTKLDMGLPV